MSKSTVVRPTEWHFAICCVGATLVCIESIASHFATNPFIVSNYMRSLTTVQQVPLALFFVHNAFRVETPEYSIKLR